MASKFYAVKNGIKPGIYYSWDECKKNVDGYKGAIYKSFKTLDEAKAFMSPSSSFVGKKDGNYSFVDGSYNNVTKTYGYGGFLQVGNEKYILQGSGNDEEMASMRNVSGEILGAMASIEKALELGLTEITIYYDYMGIEMWASGAWKRNKIGTIAYYDYIQSVKDKIQIRFVKVKAHSNIEGNEEADRLAKQAVGIEG